MNNIVLSFGYSPHSPLYRVCSDLLSFYYSAKGLEFCAVEAQPRGVSCHCTDRTSGRVVLLLQNEEPKKYFLDNGRLSEAALLYTLERTHRTYEYLLNKYNVGTRFFLTTATSLIVPERLRQIVESTIAVDRLYAGKVNYAFVEGSCVPFLSGAGKLVDYRVLEILYRRLGQNEYLLEDDFAEGLATQDIKKLVLERCDITNPPRDNLNSSYYLDYRATLLSALREGQFHFRFKTSNCENSRLAIDSRLMAVAIEFLAQKDYLWSGSYDSYLAEIQEKEYSKLRRVGLRPEQIFTIL